MSYIHNTIDSVYGYIAFENGLGLEPAFKVLLPTPRHKLVASIDPSNRGSV